MDNKQEDVIKKELGNYIRKIRKEKGLTLEALGEIIGYSNPYISQIENGKKDIPSPAFLVKLAKGLDIPSGNLLMMAGYIDDPFEYIQKSSNNKVEKIHVDDLHDLLTKKEKVYYKNKLLSSNDKTRVIDMLNILFEKREGE